MDDTNGSLSDSDATIANQPPRTFLSDLGPGQKINEPFVISNVQLKINKKGDPYLTMQVGDKSRVVVGNWWDQGEAMFRRLPNPGVVRVKGVIEEFAGRPQVKIEKILQIRDESGIDYTDLLPSTDKDIDQMFGELTAILDGFESPTLKSLAKAYLADEELMKNLRRAPAAMGFHHAYLGGLLEHTLNAMKAADLLAALHPTLNKELCVFGVFVHDLAKTWELQYETGFDYTDGGRLVGHIVKAALWLEDKAKEADVDVPRDLLDVLQHIVLSHHGELELGFGSAKSPATPEALFVHHVENLDAKMTMALDATRRSEGANDPSRWTGFMKALGGRLLKPDVLAEADAKIGQTPSSDNLF
ncbi:MAG: HD domain-containing protein [Planctomycetota bacterium]